MRRQRKYVNINASQAAKATAGDAITTTKKVVRILGPNQPCRSVKENITANSRLVYMTAKNPVRRTIIHLQPRTKGPRYLTVRTAGPPPGSSFPVGSKAKISLRALIIRMHAASIIAACPSRYK
jgi:hypothetical protein